MRCWRRASPWMRPPGAWGVVCVCVCGRQGVWFRVQGVYLGCLLVSGALDEARCCERSVSGRWECHGGAWVRELLSMRGGGEGLQEWM